MGGVSGSSEKVTTVNIQELFDDNDFRCTFRWCGLVIGAIAQATNAGLGAAAAGVGAMEGITTVFCQACYGAMAGLGAACIALPLAAIALFALVKACEALSGNEIRDDYTVGPKVNPPQ